jgi:hypothetical protein
MAGTRSTRDGCDGRRGRDTKYRGRVIVAIVLPLALVVVGCSSNASRTAPKATTFHVSPSTVTAPPTARITQPAQPASGPGSSALTNRRWRVSSGGTGVDGWYVFEPIAPRPRSAPVAIVLHGYSEFAGFSTMYEFIRHTVRTGSVVVYPRWQTGIATPCAGPFDIEPCMRSAVNGIRGGLAFLRRDPHRVQPDVDHASYFGFSFGGIITANLANRYQRLHLPQPKAIFLDDPHDGGLNGVGEPALDDSMSGIPSTVRLECHVGAEGVIAEDPTGGCNALFPKLRHIPAANKAIVLTEPDGHGQPALSSKHGVCTAFRDLADAYDWNFCWKVWDALRTAAASGASPQAAIADTPHHRTNGTWSDGTRIAPLKVRHVAPIRP